MNGWERERQKRGRQKVWLYREMCKEGKRQREWESERVRDSNDSETDPARTITWWLVQLLLYSILQENNQELAQKEYDLAELNFLEAEADPNVSHEETRGLRIKFLKIKMRGHEKTKMRRGLEPPSVQRQVHLSPLVYSEHASVQDNYCLPIQQRG